MVCLCAVGGEHWRWRPRARGTQYFVYHNYVSFVFHNYVSYWRHDCDCEASFALYDCMHYSYFIIMLRLCTIHFHNQVAYWRHDHDQEASFVLQYCMHHSYLNILYDYVYSSVFHISASYWRRHFDYEVPFVLHDYASFVSYGCIIRSSLLGTVFQSLVSYWRHVEGIEEAAVGWRWLQSEEEMATDAHVNSMCFDRALATAAACARNSSHIT